ncbi:uncharacterized protein N7483_011395 [Penicillium malachiteum]|uniref:uncharacterized protein n=1 Tax=Penicillium malachiteum TaxID=1324776 RepID=UPI002549A3F4|nr:uncharacterized protein N7483_011395 [Penicillium malachiteum]KAJ5714214.1 hypothetical protein N7483_011395 [Penicillium malachiteum]
MGKLKSSTEAKPTQDQDLFNPDKITLPLFHQLLQCYPQTVSHIHRRKITQKAQSKSKTKGSKKRPAEESKTTDPDVQTRIDADLDKFLELDRWRYEDMSKGIASRQVKKGSVLSKDEAVSIMEWKITHGHSRPMLMGLIRSNAEPLVSSCVSAALSALPKADSEEFPQASLDALQPLRGVGPATASLILSIMTGCSDTSRQVPFYSDDAFLWLCLQAYPKIEDNASEKDVKSGFTNLKPSPVVLKVRYTLNEYRELWDASNTLHRRLNEGLEAGQEPVSQNDIEKVAYVLHNIDVSGFQVDGSVAGIPDDAEPETVKLDEVVEEKAAGEVQAGRNLRKRRSDVGRVQEEKKRKIK